MHGTQSARVDEGLASCSCGELCNAGLGEINVAACCCNVCTRSGGQCPSALTAQPSMKSRYWRPLLSHSIEPWPRSIICSGRGVIDINADVGGAIGLGALLAAAILLVGLFVGVAKVVVLVIVGLLRLCLKAGVTTNLRSRPRTRRLQNLNVLAGFSLTIQQPRHTSLSACVAAVHTFLRFEFLRILWSKI